MTTKIKILPKSEIKKIKTPALAKKHACSEDYVRRVISGNRAGNTELARMILMDANDILAIYERDTKNLLENQQESNAI